MISYLPIILMVLGTTCYQIAQRSVPTHVKPFSSLILNYATALAVTLVLMSLYHTRMAERWSVENLNWASCAVGVSIVGVELGVLLAYRTGWKISTLSVIGNTASSILLVVIGLLFFHEHLSGRGLIGVVLSLVGLVLIAHR
jgi:drug/metabolite transporter (DMT)-like permease